MIASTQNSWILNCLGLAWQKENRSIWESSLKELETPEVCFLKNISLPYTNTNQNSDYRPSLLVQLLSGKVEPLGYPKAVCT